MTFDYLMFVVCAAWIAAMGLGTNSSATVIASMLVSPIMGPVMGLTFGTTVKKKDLIIKGFVNERKRKYKLDFLSITSTTIGVAV